MAVLLTPVVLLTSAPDPRLVLLCDAATPARENEKMSAAKKTKKHEPPKTRKFVAVKTKTFFMFSSQSS